MKNKKSTDFWVASNRDMTGLIPAGPVDIEELEDYEELYPMYPSKNTIQSALEIIIHPPSGWFFRFGLSPNTTGHAQVRLLIGLPAMH